MKIYGSITQLVGATPLLELKGLENSIDTNAKILAKVEFFNPAGSIKDRVALRMIEKAEKEGRLTPDSVIIEPTSGNTGIGLAAVCASRGYRLIIVMPDNMSKERVTLMKAYGAELVLTDGSLGMKGAIDKADEIASTMQNAIIAGQFENPANPEAHYISTGPEIFEDTDGEVDILISAVGTGGTISGTGRYLKEKKPSVKVVAVEPEGSPYLSRGIAGAHKIQGIGAGFVPKTLDISIIDEIITVSDEDAMSCARQIAKSEGLLVGISSGAAIAAAKLIAKRPEAQGKTVVVILPDTGERYLSSELFNS
ncbi:MAG: cysteine synthase A [Ruminococcaceae bacterium]|nr:cysteine synthase A [Oscillospiraceae bacterium]